MGLLCERPEGSGELSAGQISREQSAEDGVSEVGHGLAVVPRAEISHVQNAAFPRLSRGAGKRCPRTAARVRVFNLYAPFVSAASQAQIDAIVDDLGRRHIAIALEAGVMNVGPASTQPASALAKSLST